jgi:lysophospholipase L1-like esterase
MLKFVVSKRTAVVSVIALALVSTLLGLRLERDVRPRPVAAEPHQAVYWDGAIRDFERADQKKPPRLGSVLFVGSSSIRLWKGLARDMEPLATINRGFGGSHIAHTTHFVDRIVAPYEPRGIVMYAGDNDVARDLERTPGQVLDDVKDFLAATARAGADAPVYYVSIKPSPARMEHWPRMAAANALIEAFAERSPRLTFIDVASAMLDERGQPRPELFGPDGLHMNRQGYALWTGIIRPILERDLGVDAS